MRMETSLKIAGILLMALAFIHVIFPRYFNWKHELNSLSLINRQLMYIHSFFIAFVVFLMGFLCITSSKELATTDLGKRICLGLGVFWTTRLLVQFFGFSVKLWRSKRFETIVHVLFSVLWIYLSVLFILTYLYGR